MTGVERIAKEQKRQIEEKGFTAEHDDKWRGEELVRAAICYAYQSRDVHGLRVWPRIWNAIWYKSTPDNRIHELEKAGALIAAEIDRFLREKEYVEHGCEYEPLNYMEKRSCNNCIHNSLKGCTL